MFGLGEGVGCLGWVKGWDVWVGGRGGVFGLGEGLGCTTILGVLWEG